MPRTLLHNLQAYVDFNVAENSAVRFGYVFEDYEASDWPIDCVAPDTIPSALSLGERSFVYDAHVPTIAFRYRPTGD